MRNVAFYLLFLAEVYFSSCEFPTVLSEERQCFTDLSISELLKLKRSVDELNCSPDDDPRLHRIQARVDDVSETLNTNHSALPLIGEINPRSYSDHVSVDPWHERPTKIQTVFQVSITALTFLAFGGYLLCMIVQAIKSKGTTYLHSMTGTNTSGGTVSTLKKIKIYRRTRRDSPHKEPNWNVNERQMLAGPTPEELFNVLTFMAEGYVKMSSI